MKSIRYISHNENETKKLAVQIASKLNIGDIIVLTGELGSGKTKFTEGFLSYFNLDKEISSPTFTIVNDIKIQIFQFSILMFIVLKMLMNFTQ